MISLNHLECNDMIDQLIPYRSRILAVSIGIIYLWFGVLKLFPGACPAEELVKETMWMMTFGLIPPKISYFLLALWEVTIGIFLVLNLRKKVIIYLALVHILFTFSPLFLFPSLSFNERIFTLTLVGQYIIKNLIIFSSLLFILPEKQQSIAEGA